MAVTVDSLSMDVSDCEAWVRDVAPRIFLRRDSVVFFYPFSRHEEEISPSAQEEMRRVHRARVIRERPEMVYRYVLRFDGLGGTCIASDLATVRLIAEVVYEEGRQASPECPECFGTGFHKGWGAACARGCPRG